MIVITLRDSPIPKWGLRAIRGKSGSIYVMYFGPNSTGHLASYDGTWWGARIRNFEKDVPAWESLYDELINRAGITRYYELTMRRRVGQNPFWKQFVQDVEDIWIITEVMLS